MASLDPRRFGGWMTTEYAAKRMRNAYEHVFILHHPDEEREAASRCAPPPPMTRQIARRADGAGERLNARTTRPSV